MRRAAVFGEDVQPVWSAGLLAAGVALGGTFVATLDEAGVGERVPTLHQAASNEPTASGSIAVRASATAGLPALQPVATSVVPSAAASASPATGCRALTIEFASRTVTPPPTAVAALGKIAAHLRAHGSATLRIDGHADARGDETENLVLSRHRADAVAALIERAGIDRARLSVRAFGAFQPIDGVEETSAVQRRVVVVVRNTESCPEDLPETALP
ncbi:MAG: OmpA family protein [Polyangiales bacterium]